MVVTCTLVSLIAMLIQRRLQNFGIGGVTTYYVRYACAICHNAIRGGATIVVILKCILKTQCEWATHFLSS